MTSDFTIADLDDARIGLRVGFVQPMERSSLVLSADATPSRAGHWQREFEATFEPEDSDRDGDDDGDEVSDDSFTTDPDDSGTVMTFTRDGDRDDADTEDDADEDCVAVGDDDSGGVQDGDEEPAVDPLLPTNTSRWRTNGPRRTEGLSRRTSKSTPSTSIDARAHRLQDRTGRAHQQPRLPDADDQGAPLQALEAAAASTGTHAKSHRALASGLVGTPDSR